MRIALFLLLLMHGAWGVEWIARDELRWAYQNLEARCWTQVARERFDQLWIFSSGSSLFFRIDIPYVWLNCSETVFIEVDGEGIIDVGDEDKAMMPITHPVKEHGFADLVTKLLYTTRAGKSLITVGSEFIFPTAQAKEIGSGKYQAVPTIELKYNIAPETSLPQWFYLMSKFQFSYAGKSDRSAIDIWFIQPKLELWLPHEWALTIDTEIQFNWNEKSWFVPLDLGLIKGFHKHLFIALEYKVGLVRNFPVFKQDVEAAISYVF